MPCPPPTADGSTGSGSILGCPVDAAAITDGSGVIVMVWPDPGPKRPMPGPIGPMPMAMGFICMAEIDDTACTSPTPTPTARPFFLASFWMCVLDKKCVLQRGPPRESRTTHAAFERPFSLCVVCAPTTPTN